MESETPQNEMKNTSVFYGDHTRFRLKDRFDEEVTQVTEKCVIIAGLGFYCNPNLKLLHTCSAAADCPPTFGGGSPAAQH